MGTTPHDTMGGSKYFVVFVDDYSHYTWIYLMKNRYQISQIISNFAAMIQTQFFRTIKMFRTDNAMENKETDL